MKKTFALITILILCLMLVGCGEEADDMDETEDMDETDDMTVETPSPETTPEPTPDTEEPETTEPTTEMPEEPETTEPTTEEPEETKTASNFQLITIKDFTPYPQELTVKVGTTVRWTTTDENFLHIIAWRGFKGMQLTKDMTEGVEYTFEEPGVIQWFSTAKPAIQGTITVE